MLGLAPDSRASHSPAPRSARPPGGVPPPEKGFRVQGVQGLGFGVQGLGFRVQGLGFGIQGSAFRVWGLGFRVQGSDNTQKRLLEVYKALEGSIGAIHFQN